MEFRARRRGEDERGRMARQKKKRINVYHGAPSNPSNSDATRDTSSECIVHRHVPVRSCAQIKFNIVSRTTTHVSRKAIDWPEFERVIREHDARTARRRRTRRKSEKKNIHRWNQYTGVNLRYDHFAKYLLAIAADYVNNMLAWHGAIMTQLQKYACVHRKKPLFF